MESASGYREHAHTADWELEVWAPDLPGLLEQSARGMYSLSGVTLRTGTTQNRSIALHGADAESLLVQFLSELLWFEQEDGLGFDQFSIHIDDQYNMRADLQGGLITNLDKEIKAVTYHNLQVEATPRGYRVTIVFDV